MAVGIYISGASRACRSQPNLTATWVSTQARPRLAACCRSRSAHRPACSTRYPKYGAAIDPKISANNANGYATARNQGRIEADRAVVASRALGITQGSTLFYDLEAFDITNATCKASAIRFLDSWTVRLHALGYKSGYYSSAGSGIKMVNDFKAKYPTTFTYPDTLWIARWDGAANTSVRLVVPRPDGVDPGPPDQAVPGRAQRDLGRRHDQHRPQLPRGSAPAWCPAARCTAAASRST
ncbi:glycoside hydrolase domain-containing protein [Nocardioides convexus]|uniref:glycoside hydrolase domain-containing protein n=1 Tax=Nocardioides convexus TaxID=2712224 RepID=UPI00241824BF|nr:glycoside hydrolase domain-containing protein [Nocardioides convexus]